MSHPCRGERSQPRGRWPVIASFLCGTLGKQRRVVPWKVERGGKLGVCPRCGWAGVRCCGAAQSCDDFYLHHDHAREVANLGKDLSDAFHGKQHFLETTFINF